MPIYRFKCRACGDEFDDFRNLVEKRENGSCLSCGSPEIERTEDLTASCDCNCGCGCSGGPEPEC